MREFMRPLCVLLALTATLALPVSALAADAPTSNAAATQPAPSKSAPGKIRAGIAPCTAWVDPDVEPRAALLCVHGLGLHNKSYEAFGERMAKQGIATYAVDVRGFGSFQEADGEQNRDVDFEYCLQDVAKALKFIQRAHQGLPVFILGESMGGAIALRVTAEHPELVDGLISCVPSGDRFRQGKTDLKVAVQFLKGSNKKFDIGTSVINQASADQQGNVNEDLRAAWAKDELNRLTLSPRELMQFQSFMNDNHESAKKITKTPVLMVQGWDDNLVKSEGTLELWKELSCDDKEIALINKAKHLIFEMSEFNDQALREKTDKIVLRWIDDHIPKPATAAMPEQKINKAAKPQSPLN